MPADQFRVERATRASRIGAVAGLLGLGVLATLPFWGRSSDMRTIIELISLLSLAQMWNLLAGYAGLVSIGQQAYVGLGGYALFVLGNVLAVNPFVAVPLAGLVAAGFAMPTAAVVFRLRGAYFAVGTWVVAEVYRLSIANISALGGGSGQTLTAIRGYSRFAREATTYWIALAIGVAAIALVYLLLRSRHGLALTAIRDSEPASMSLGVNVLRAKLIVYVAAAFGSGLVGALIYLNLLRISPDAAFGVNWTAFMIFIVVIGGIGTIEGPILGTLAFFLLRELLGDFGTWYLILLGSIAVLVMLKAPQGLWGLIAARYDCSFFPVQRRLRVLEPSADP